MEETRPDFLETLQELFGYSHECVCITDFKLQLLWMNRPAKIRQFTSCGMLFEENDGARIQSGTYFCKLGDDSYRFRVLRYPYPEAPTGGYLILFLEEEDTLRAMLRSQSIREYVENCTGEIRQSVTGITMASNMLHGLLEKRGVCTAETSWLNITLNNCYRLLKSVTAISDTVRYADEPETPELLNLGELLRGFTSVCAELLCNVMEVTCEAEKDLAVYVPANWLLNCLLSLLLLSRGNDANRNRLIVTAHRNGDFAVLSLSATVGGAPAAEGAVPYQTCPLHEATAESEEYLVRRFCDAYSGVLEKAETPEARVYRLTLPLQAGEGSCTCCSAPAQYADDRFSRYHIALSSLTQIKYFNA